MSSRHCGTDILYAVELLKAGQLVAFPTETVYGLGGDAGNEFAIRKIFAAKGRPIDHPLIVHLADKSQLPEWASFISPVAWQLAEAFWPGPLTMILPKHPTVSMLLTGHQPSIGLRVPRHPLALELLKAFGRGIAAPSANRFGHLSPTTSAHVLEELGQNVDYVLEGGACDIGIESTIVYIQDNAVSILRQGQITRSDLEAVIQKSVTLSSHAPTLRVSGAYPIHYAPDHPLYVIPFNELTTQIHSLLEKQKPVGVLSFSPPLRHSPLLFWVTLPKEPHTYAHFLYSTLRELDKQGKYIVVEMPPLDPAWSAIHERLARAKTVISGN